MFNKYKSVFPEKNVLLTVVHASTLEQTIENVRIAVDSNVHGIFLIGHSMPSIELARIVKKVRSEFTEVWLGVNFLDLRPRQAFQTIGKLEQQWYRIDGMWTDNPEIHGNNPGYSNQEANANAIREIGWQWLYFWWVAFKHQQEPEDLAVACRQGKKYLDVITTSWPATGRPAEREKIERIRKLSDRHPIGLASGVTHENVHQFSELVDAFIVASSLNKERDFFNFDAAKVRDMSDIFMDLNS